MRTWWRWMMCGLIAWAMAGCLTTKSEFEDLKTEVDTIQAEQEVMQKTLSASKADMAEMIAEARKENAALKASIKEAEKMLARNDAETGVDLQQMRAELDRLRGKVEELEFQLGRMEEDIRVFKEDVDLRMQGSVASAELPEDATELFELGESTLNEGKARAARDIFEAFIERHPEDTRVDDAVYLVGESYFNNGRYYKALYEYEKILKNYSDSDRMAETILRIGQSSKRIGKCEQAKVFFETLTSDYKRTKAAKAAAEELKKGCSTPAQ